MFGGSDEYWLTLIVFVAGVLLMIGIGIGAFAMWVFQ